MPVSIVLYIDGTYLKKGIPIRPVYSKCIHIIPDIIPDWVPAQKGDRATCAENCPGPATQKGCLTARQELSRQRVGLASPDNTDTHDSNGGRGRRGRGGGVTSYTLAASVEDREPAELQAT